ncbi:MAG TPA: uroporphyrinogen decarboxylase family protein [Dehalococcoidia bacterium]|nr:uroporphyrinogen decarboxylase family protein [Dehalococcoidia bacterium]
MQTTVVGNYPKVPNRPRPARLRVAINKRDRSEITNQDLARIEDEVTAEVIGEQVEAGLDIVTDGQVRWDDDQTYIARRLKGIEIGSLERYLDTNTYYRQPEITGPISWEAPILVRDFLFAKANSSKPVKAIVTGPYTLAALSVDKHYNSREKLTMALAEALRNEVLALADAGAQHLQVNDPVILRNKDDVRIAVKALTLMLDGVSAGTGVYTWFGDAAGVLPALLDTPADVIGLDFVAGPGNWDALKSVSFNKKLGFGIVDGRNTRLDPPQAVADAIKRVSELVPQDRLYVNPSCGLEYVPRETAFDKLKQMVDGARRAEGVPA